MLLGLIMHSARYLGVFCWGAFNYIWSDLAISLGALTALRCEGNTVTGERPQEPVRLLLTSASYRHLLCSLSFWKILLVFTSIFIFHIFPPDRPETSRPHCLQSGAWSCGPISWCCYVRQIAWAIKNQYEGLLPFAGSLIFMNQQSLSVPCLPCTDLSFITPKKTQRQTRNAQVGGFGFLKLCLNGTTERTKTAPCPTLIVPIRGPSNLCPRRRVKSSNCNPRMLISFRTIFLTIPSTDD